MGDKPPLVGVAVKVTGAPVHIVVWLAVTDTLGVGVIVKFKILVAQLLTDVYRPELV